VRLLASNYIYAKKDRNGPPNAYQVASKEEPRRGHAVCTLGVHPPPHVPPFLLTQKLPISMFSSRLQKLFLLKIRIQLELLDSVATSIN